MRHRLLYLVLLFWIGLGVGLFAPVLFELFRSAT